jgi:tRNA(Ile)-lysidine synthase
MEIKLKPEKYIIAVSGGVDSMVLLDLFIKQAMGDGPEDRAKKTQGLIIAHFDHGIHEKSSEYRNFVATEAKLLGIKFVYEEGNLGPQTSEAKAREARYKFLEKTRNEYKAAAILTAHHEDDLIETMLINVIRGTGAKGLSSLQSSNNLIRPLLGYSKKQIISYAKGHNIEWKEDPTNKEEKYLRNYLRLNILPKMSLRMRRKLLEIADESKTRNNEIKDIINDIALQKDSLNRKIINSLDHNSSKEVLASFLRHNKIVFDAKILELGVNFIKTAESGKKFTISNGRHFEIEGDEVRLNLL